MTEFILKIQEIQQINEKLDRINQKIDSVLNKKPDTEIWLTTKQAAQALQITTRTLQSYRDQGMIEVLPIHRTTTGLLIIDFLFL